MENNQQDIENEDAEYPASRYLSAADALAACTEHECHPALCVNRERYAASLRKMALNPKNKNHQASLRTTDFLIYTRRAKYIYGHE